MDSSRLMNRTDHKFLFSPDKLAAILKNLPKNYRILSIENHRVFTYKSYYFDTSDFEFYKVHHNGKTNRHKVRFRNYVETGATFLEVKFKNNKGRTIKNRVSVEAWEDKLSEDSKEFIHRISGIRDDLELKMENKFQRFTLVNKDHPERVTFDFNIHYRCGSEVVKYDHIAIAEVKQEQFNRQSTIMNALKEQRCYPDSISKYCLGIFSCYPTIKQNRFKPHLLKISKMQSQRVA